MHPVAKRLLLILLLAGAVCAAAQQSVKPADGTIRGWLSDEGCARGRASSGTFTATNPECAKECVAKGKKIVLIDPDRKMIFDISNQSLAKNNVGDYVEISGETNLQAKTIRIGSLKMLSVGVASCARPKLDH
jgi:hypothetical protein